MSPVSERFREGDQVRVSNLHKTWDAEDQWVQGSAGTVSGWHPDYDEWIVWILTPGEEEPTLWMFSDDELELVARA